MTSELNKNGEKHTQHLKSKNAQKKTPESLPKTDFIFGVAPPGTLLVAQPASGNYMMATSAPRVLPVIGSPRITPKSTTIATRPPRVKPFRGPAWRTARSDYNINNSFVRQNTTIRFVPQKTTILFVSQNINNKIRTTEFKQDSCRRKPH